MMFKFNQFIISLVAIAVIAYAPCVQSAPSGAATPDVPKPDDQQKEITNQEIIEMLKQAVKPVELKEPSGDPVVIHYEAPRQGIKTSLGDPSVPSDLNLVVSKGSGLEQQKDILEQAYKAALLGQFEASVFLYKKALKEDLRNTNILFGLGSLYQKLHQYDEAREMYKKVLAIDPKHQKAVHNYISLIASESPSNALAELADIEKVNPNFSPLQAQIGMVLASIGDYMNAANHLKRAIEISPEIVNYRYNLAVVYDHLGAYESAISLYDQTLKFTSAGESLPQDAGYIRARIMYLQKQVLKAKEKQAQEEIINVTSP